MKIYKKIIACLLVGTITLCSNYVNISAKGKTATAPQKTKFKNEYSVLLDNGEKLVIRYDDYSKVQVENKKTAKIIDASLDKKTNQYTFITYKYNKKKGKYKIVKEIESDFSELLKDEKQVKGQLTGKYKSSNKVVCKWKTGNGNNYWYNISTNKPKRVSFGCVKKYERKYYTSKRATIDSYMSAIKKSNSSYSKAVAILGTEDVVLAIIVVIMSYGACALGTAMTEGMFLSICGTTITATSAGASALYSAYDNYCDVVTYYNLLK